MKRARTKYFRPVALGVTTATVLLCTACFSGDQTSSSSEKATTTPTPTPTSTYTPSQSVGDGPQAPNADEVPENPEWTPEDEDAAKQVAEDALADFARPDVEEAQWANDFARWLTPEATTSYSAVDPANVPVKEVTGPATLDIDETNGFGVIATVPTDIGDYGVQLLRQGQDEPWKVNRLYPPEGAN
ncbi:hypothetical protein [Arthrobacter sp. AET 35A]|uniref:hypothetical protein n=1 Tax=Arthrobacter sp. AET 35A TaxID=2292643 RepID=UPI001786CD30|nr:hypothetical protein [Arthrobacter sp. AET 35A]MBE0011617.1 hypothetical protein [Arthrobacter sp. AET 35A]